MDVNLALVAFVFVVALFIAAGAYMDGRQQASRPIPIVRPAYRPVRNRDRRSRW